VLAADPRGQLGGLTAKRVFSRRWLTFEPMLHHRPTDDVRLVSRVLHHGQVLLGIVSGIVAHRQRLTT